MRQLMIASRTKHDIKQGENGTPSAGKAEKEEKRFVNAIAHTNGCKKEVKVLL